VQTLTSKAGPSTPSPENSSGLSPNVLCEARPFLI
jgi:hypothetical protein